MYAPSSIHSSPLWLGPRIATIRLNNCRERSGSVRARGARAAGGRPTQANTARPTAPRAAATTTTTTGVIHRRADDATPMNSDTDEEAHSIPPHRRAVSRCAVAAPSDHAARARAQAVDGAARRRDLRRGRDATRDAATATSAATAGARAQTQPNTHRCSRAAHTNPRACRLRHTHRFDAGRRLLGVDARAVRGDLLVHPRERGRDLVSARLACALCLLLLVRPQHVRRAHRVPRRVPARAVAVPARPRACRRREDEDDDTEKAPREDDDDGAPRRREDTTTRARELARARERARGGDTARAGIVRFGATRMR